MSGVQARLREREEARKAALEERRRERESERREEETAGHFTREFTIRKKAIEDLLQSVDEVPQEKLSSHFDTISTECQSLQKFVSDSTLFLTSYSIRSCQQQLSQLLQEVTRKQDQLMPRRGFAFKSRKKEAAQTAHAQTTTAGDRRGGEKEEEMRPERVAENFVGFRDQKNKKLSLSADEVKGHAVNLSHLRSCEVKLFGSPSTLHMSAMEECVVLCGPVTSSVFVEGCSDCTIVVACQQLRVHTTRHSTFFLHVSSRAIIEDCSEVTFAPYNWSYPESESHFELCGFDRSQNNWNKVDDFNWLASSDPSPSWSILPETERTRPWQ